jgi:hypothetical protein
MAMLPSAWWNPDPSKADQAVRDRTHKEPRTDILNALGIDHQSFKDKMLRLAFSASGEYFSLRSSMRKKILEGVMLAIYELIYNTLTNGTLSQQADGTTAENNILHLDDTTPSAVEIFGLGKKALGISPAFSKEEANRIAVGIAASFKTTLEKEIIDRLMPASVFDNALHRAKKVSEIQMLGN